MKRIMTIAVALVMTANLWAQSPEKMSYQAVVRNATNALVKTQAVGMRVSILQATATGTAVYTETHTPTTNANGLVSLEIGGGTVVTGTFEGIDWSMGPYFLKTEIDPTGGTNYTISGTNQLMSVPYALHATTAERITGTVNYTENDPVFGASIASGITQADTANWNNHITTENDPVFGASIASGITQADTANWNNHITTETDPVFGASIANGITQADTANWNNNEIQTISRTGTTVTLTKGGGTFTDSVNTYTAGTNIAISADNVISATSGAGGHYIGESFGGGVVYQIYTGSDGQQHGLIVNTGETSDSAWQRAGTTTGATSTWDGDANTKLMTDSPAATYVKSLTTGGFTDWYLPSISELNPLWENAFIVNRALRKVTGATLVSIISSYWSSTETGSSIAFIFYFYSGSSGFKAKSSVSPVRAIRAF